MKIIHLSHSDILGGASRATNRVHQMLANNGIKSSMWVDIKKSDDPEIVGPESNIQKYFNSMKQHLRFPVNKLLKSNLYGMHSPSILSSRWLKKINASDADIIHLHWIQGEMLSIKEISEIKKPLVWTFHDMWPFCGCEHYAYNQRYSEGYKVNNKSKNEFSFFDINRWQWNQKVRLFKKPIQILSPSNWMTNCVKKSNLMKDWPVKTIPHPIDISKWRPLDKNISRKKLNLPKNSKLILFGAIGGTRDKRKGFAVLEKALKHLKYSDDNINLIIFGGDKKDIYPKVDLKIFNFFEVNDDTMLQTIYSAADLMIVPSKLEAFGLTAQEALSCGTPVVAFDGTGLSDIVKHKETGYLAKPSSEKDFVDGIFWVLENPSKNILDKNSRKRVNDLFSYQVIYKKYQNFYNNLLSSIS
jgi:glycosyltransferase involved in cell wall biosynthesis